MSVVVNDIFFVTVQQSISDFLGDNDNWIMSKFFIVIRVVKLSVCFLYIVFPVHHNHTRAFVSRFNDQVRSALYFI